jgi:hypothetical protein
MNAFWSDLVPDKVRPNNKRQPKVGGFHRFDVTYPHKTKNGIGIVGRLRKKKNK